MLCRKNEKSQMILCLFRQIVFHPIKFQPIKNVEWTARATNSVYVSVEKRRWHVEVSEGLTQTPFLAMLGFWKLFFRKPLPFCAKTLRSGLNTICLIWDMLQRWNYEFILFSCNHINLQEMVFTKKLFPTAMACCPICLHTKIRALVFGDKEQDE